MLLQLMGSLCRFLSHRFEDLILKMNNWQWSFAIFLIGAVFFLLYSCSVKWKMYLTQETSVLKDRLKLKEEFTDDFPAKSQWLDISNKFLPDGKKIDRKAGSHVVVLLAAVAVTNGTVMPGV